MVQKDNTDCIWMFSRYDIRSRPALSVNTSIQDAHGPSDVGHGGKID